MYGLKQAGLLANQLLQTRLAPFGYYPARHTQNYGCIKLGLSLSRSLWTILRLSMWARNMQSISGTPFCELIN
jgi:hypothetical protein